MLASLGSDIFGTILAVASVVLLIVALFAFVRPKSDKIIIKISELLASWLKGYTIEEAGQGISSNSLPIYPEAIISHAKATQDTIIKLANNLKGA